MGNIYIIRHGRTEWNREKVFRGRADMPLDEDGRREAACAAEALRDVPLASIYTSPLSRSYETAVIVSRANGADVETCQELIDIDYGDWTGIRDEDVRQQFSSLYSTWETAPDQVRFPGGETLSEVEKRAMPALKGIAEAHESENVALVSHRVVIKVLLCALKGLDCSHFWEIKLDTAAISEVSYDRGEFRIIKENDSKHMRGLDTKPLADF